MAFLVASWGFLASNAVFGSLYAFAAPVLGLFVALQIAVLRPYLYLLAAFARGGRARWRLAAFRLVRFALGPDRPPAHARDVAPSVSRFVETLAVSVSASATLLAFLGSQSPRIIHPGFFFSGDAENECKAATALAYLVVGRLLDSARWWLIRSEKPMPLNVSVPLRRVAPVLGVALVFDLLCAAGYQRLDEEAATRPCPADTTSTWPCFDSSSPRQSRPAFSPPKVDTVRVDAVGPATIPRVVARARPFGTFFYFSTTTLTTVGYGEITPAAPVARALAMIEMAGSVVLISVALASALSGAPDVAPRRPDPGYDGPDQVGPGGQEPVG